MHALLCIGIWSVLGYVKDSDLMTAAVLPKLDGEEDELAEDWDTLRILYS